MVYNVIVTLSFEADSSEAAERKAENALSLIPAQDAPEMYGIDTIYAPDGQDGIKLIDPKSWTNLAEREVVPGLKEFTERGKQK